ncbi:hypothetical protein GSI_10217 [Ganoderma sinense ZZ0214-1]|uniref:Fungal lipase-type domain-containing protein n=1 Tax=Ganoderma sinense ZZ0214-1 TaxID=1077348 RepID=A0A2G8S0J8_9APHY|nr:hypothetical protein GSI_10217 [Ganoderma sinense ZZ0214-1]
MPLRQDDIVPLPPHLIAAFKPYTAWYAATTACNLSAIMHWSCGENCNANPTFKPIIAGGDNEETPFWFVGYDLTLDEVIVSHYGTDFGNRKSIWQNFLFCQVPLNSDMFPGVDESVRVHKGYARVQSRSAAAVIAAVEQALSQHSTKKVTVVGHSMGAAVALLDAIYLSLHLSSDVTVRYIGYSSPRVGNQAFADYVDTRGMSVTRINNKQDPIPVLPPMTFFGYRHVSGEIHIRNDDVWVSCPGQDNPSDQCSTGAVTAVIFGNGDMSQHTGPFDGVTMGKC